MPSSRYNKSIRVLRYANKGKEFALSIKSKQKGENVVIYLPEKPGTMREAIDYLNNSLKVEPKLAYGALDDPYLHEDDTVKIPYLKLESKANFMDQLRGFRLYNDDEIPWVISAAYQEVSFEMNEKGAKVKVGTSLGEEPFGSKPVIVPRYFICDQPFFVFLWKDSADLPYLGLWIDGGEVLEKFK